MQRIPFIIIVLERGTAELAQGPFQPSSATPTSDRCWISIPRRPKWTERTTPQELVALEQASFLEWRRGLARLEEADRFILTPFERNLDIWRQLWRVTENSSVVAQIVDCRNPLLFYSSDLTRYVTEELSSSPTNLLILNKADLLTPKQRASWGEYFRGVGIEFIFYSAKDALEQQSVEVAVEDSTITSSSSALSSLSSSSSIYGPAQLMQRLRELALGGSVGMVGYPNVGKSSTINSLLGEKRVAVAATPGKTKHFQTILLDELVLCDCPGLVFPTFAASKADLVLNGILPIDQLKDWISPVHLLLQRVPLEMIEQVYGFKVISDNPTPSDLLSAHAVSRGFRTSHGNPDESRSARIILKDYVSGRLLYCHPPPSSESSAEFIADTIAHQSSRLPQRTKLYMDPRAKDSLSVAAQVVAEFLQSTSCGFQTRSVGARQPVDSARSMVGGLHTGVPTGKPSKKHYKGRK